MAKGETGLGRDRWIAESLEVGEKSAFDVLLLGYFGRFLIRRDGLLFLEMGGDLIGLFSERRFQGGRRRVDLEGR